LVPNILAFQLATGSFTDQQREILSILLNDLLTFRFLPFSLPPFLSSCLPAFLPSCLLAFISSYLLAFLPSYLLPEFFRLHRRYCML